MDLVIYLNGHARAVAFANAEASCEHHFILKMMLGNGALQKRNDLRRAFQMAGGTDANLNDQHILHTFAKISVSKNAPTPSGETE